MDYALSTPREVVQDLAGKVRALREQRGLTQQQLAAKAGIAFPTYRHFEQTGRISTERLLMVASALGRMNDFGSLFEAEEFQSLDEIEATASRKGIRR